MHTRRRFCGAAAKRLADAGTPLGVGGFGSEKKAALAASEHPCYQEGVNALLQSAKLQGGPLTHFRERISHDPLAPHRDGSLPLLL